MAQGASRPLRPSHLSPPSPLYLALYLAPLPHLRPYRSRPLVAQSTAYMRAQIMFYRSPHHFSLTTRTYRVSSDREQRANVGDSSNATRARRQASLSPIRRAIAPPARAAASGSPPTRDLGSFSCTKPELGSALLRPTLPPSPGRRNSYTTTTADGCSPTTLRVHDFADRSPLLPAIQVVLPRHRRYAHYHPLQSHFS